VPPHDILTAGFPCQPFTTIGTRKGLQDRTRGHLFFEIIRVVRVCRPRALLLENVKGLLTMAGAFDTVCRELRALGYSVQHRIINSATLLPQHRERLYIVCFRLDPTAGEASTDTSIGEASADTDTVGEASAEISGEGASCRHN